MRRCYLLCSRDGLKRALLDIDLTLDAGVWWVCPLGCKPHNSQQKKGGIGSRQETPSKTVNAVPHQDFQPSVLCQVDRLLAVALQYLQRALWSTFPREIVNRAKLPLDSWCPLMFLGLWMVSVRTWGPNETSGEAATRAGRVGYL